jgi:hypothetical protein
MDFSNTSLSANGGMGTFSNAATDTFPTTSSLTYTCSGGGSMVSYFQMRIVATVVGTVH